MTFKKKDTPWNKGEKGQSAGWTDERKREMSKRVKKYWRQHRTTRVYSSVVGPDNKIKALYYRFLRMRCQARYWCQEWSILWEDYLDIYKTMEGKWGRKKRNKNLCRIDTTKGWHLHNVVLMTRREAMRRKRAKDDDGNVIKRKRRRDE
jgi:hypothetical protein